MIHLRGFVEFIIDNYLISVIKTLKIFNASKILNKCVNWIRWLHLQNLII